MSQNKFLTKDELKELVSKSPMSILYVTYNGKTTVSTALAAQNNKRAAMFIE